MLSRIHWRSKPAALPKNASSPNSTTQTAATFSRNGTRAEASWIRSQASPMTARHSGW